MRQRCRHSLIVFLRERLTRWTPETFPGTQDQISDEDLHRTGIRVTRITCSRRVGVEVSRAGHDKEWANRVVAEVALGMGGGGGG